MSGTEAHRPPAADEHRTGVSGGAARPIPLVGAAVAVAIALVTGYAIGWARGSAGLDQGSGPTTSVVEPLPGGDASAPTTDPGELPPPPATTAGAGFDGGLEATDGDLTLRAEGDWEVVEGAARPAAPTAVDPAAEVPPAPGDAPTLVASASSELTIARVRLATATAHSGLALAVRDGGAWQLAVSSGLDRVVLYEVVDGVPEQRAFVDAPVADGIELGLVLRDGRVAILVDGEQRALQGFFGAELDVDANGRQAGDAAVVAGAGQPAFDDLAVG